MLASDLWIVHGEHVHVDLPTDPLRMSNHVFYVTDNVDESLSWYVACVHTPLASNTLLDVWLSLGPSILAACLHPRALRTRGAALLPKTLLEARSEQPYVHGLAHHGSDGSVVGLKSVVVHVGIELAITPRPNNHTPTPCLEPQRGSTLVIIPVYAHTPFPLVTLSVSNINASIGTMEPFFDSIRPPESVRVQTTPWI